MPEAANPITFPDFCIQLGIPAGCISNSSIASENGRTFRIIMQRGDQVWRVKVDHCWLHERDGAKTDYLFWCQCATGQKYIFLVELKGKNFGQALEQTRAMLIRLCKRSSINIVHRGNYYASPGHRLTAYHGVSAYVVLSSGRDVGFNQTEIAKIRKEFNIIVRSKTNQREVTLPLG